MLKIVTLLLCILLGEAFSFAGCSGSPSNSDCAQWNADQTRCQLYSRHANQCAWSDENCSGNVDCNLYASDEGACNASPGGACAWGSMCSGVVNCGGRSEGECSSYAGGGACAWVLGDPYSGIPDSCQGSPNCSGFASDEGACIAIDNCSWVTSCTLNNGCSAAINETDCGTLPSCTWNPSSCSGTMTCEAQTSLSSCQDIQCRWNTNIYSSKIYGATIY